MSCKPFHVFGEVDDFDGLEGAFFDADTTTNAEDLRDFADWWGGYDLNTDLFSFIDRTAFFALLFASFRFASLFIDNSDSVFVLHFVDELYEGKYSNFLIL